MCDPTAPAPASGSLAVMITRLQLIPPYISLHLTISGRFSPDASQDGPSEQTLWRGLSPWLSLLWCLIISNDSHLQLSTRDELVEPVD